MPPKAVAKIGLTVVVLVGALCGLLFATLREGTEYYKHVEEVMAQPGDWYARLQLHGFVVKDSILRRRDSLDYRPDREQGRNRDRELHRRCSRHVQERFRGRAEGPPQPQRVHCRSRRRHGEVSVEIRASDETVKKRSQYLFRDFTPVSADTLFGNLNG